MLGGDEVLASIDMLSGVYVLPAADGGLWSASDPQRSAKCVDAVVPAPHGARDRPNADQ